MIVRIQRLADLRFLRPPSNGRDHEEALRLRPLRRRPGLPQDLHSRGELDEQVRSLLASIAIPDEAKAWPCKASPGAMGEQRVYHQTVVQEIRTEIKQHEVVMARLYDDRLHRLISKDDKP